MQFTDSKLVRLRRSGISVRVRSTGFNLIELMTVLTVGAVLMGLGVSSYRYVTSSNRVSTEVNGLLGDLMLARSEAIKQGMQVVACPSAAGSSCDGKNTWESGWIVFSDPDGDGQYSTTATSAGTDQLLRVQKGFGTTGDTFHSDSGVNSITYNREGFAINTSVVTITLHTSTNNDQWTRCVQVAAYGSLTTERVGTGSCK